MIAGHPIGATVSIGAATAPANVGAIEKLLARADGALYQAKMEGRNRFKLAGPWAEGQRAGSETDKTPGPPARGEVIPLPIPSKAA